VGIHVTRVAGGYSVAVSPPDADRWAAAGPLTLREVLTELSARGCHSTDIADAMSAADPDWGKAHDAEIRRRRGESPEDGAG
jgi:hypothetical protein